MRPRMMRGKLGMVARRGDPAQRISAMRAGIGRRIGRPEYSEFSASEHLVNQLFFVKRESHEKRVRTWTESMAAPSRRPGTRVCLQMGGNLNALKAEWGARNKLEGREQRTGTSEA